MESNLKKETIEDFFKQLQDEICRALEKTDSKGKFHEDIWQHKAGGGGRTRLIENGRILEKGGVNFSAVQGKVSSELKIQLKITEESDFFACGVSIVQHPNNPFVPIVHMNVRYFETSNGSYWFAGGIDLTPHYINIEQAKWFHIQLKKVCDRFDPEWYSLFKSQADEYFYLPHREETRGIGGIFFDHLNEESSGKSKTEIFEFVKAIGELFAPTYTELMQINAILDFSEENKKWQMLRRGRYVEFNLIWDRGTKFGLITNGRTESILMSLPPVAHWAYDFKPLINSEEAHTLDKLKKGIDWINL